MHVTTTAYSGSAEGFIEFALNVFKTGPRNIHQITNILIEFSSPEEAAVESYFAALQRAPDKAGTLSQALICGRYCDLFRKRKGIRELPNGRWSMIWSRSRFWPRHPMPIGTWCPDDPVYAFRKTAFLQKDESEA
ncbi:SnoaL-like domain-containing protein (plasmid) [Rhizobium etli bv. phaseoli str. IE4803]|nr:SnoaL-like domain-containing protein [Rhizobium etli bv. phaseoli str. IE4803]ARQ60797.1 NTF2 domain-containing protein [Rhizobium sp. Kim5]